MSTTTNEIIRSQKAGLRKLVRAKLKSLSSNEIEEQSSKVWEKVRELDCYKSAQSIGLFLSMPTNEIQTNQILLENVMTTRLGGVSTKKVYVPRVGLDFEACDMDLIEIKCSTAPDEIWSQWPRNKWNIPEPPSNNLGTVAVTGDDIDVLIVPGLAFDRRGARLGQGKGYYDRFIAKMRNQPSSSACSTNTKPILVAVGLDCQLLSSSGEDDYCSDSSSSESLVPTHEHDYLMDMVITPSHTLVFDR